MISLIPTQYKILIGVAVVCVLCGGSYLKGRDVGMQKYYAFKAEVEVANARVAEANRLKIEQAEQVTREVAQRYAAYAGDIERTYVSRLAGLRREASRCATLSPVAASTEGADAGTADSGLAADSYAAICTRLERDCAKTTLMVYGLQDYVTGVCK